MYSILKSVIFNIILQDKIYKIVLLNDKEKSIKVEFVQQLNCEITATNQLYNSSLIDFSLTFNVGLNILIYRASLTFLFTQLL